MVLPDYYLKGILQLPILRASRIFLRSHLAIILVIWPFNPNSIEA